MKKQVLGGCFFITVIIIIFWMMPENTIKISGNSSAQVSNEENLPVLTIYTYRNDSPLTDADEVVAAINNYIKPLIHAQIDVNYITYGSYSSYLNQLLDANEPVDLFLSSSGSDLETMYHEGRIAPLNDLLTEYGSAILQSVSPEYLQIGQDFTTGNYYGVLTCHDYATRLGIEYRTDIAEKYNIDMSQVNTIHDLTTVFHNLKLAAPDIYPIVSVSAYHPWDLLGDGLGVLLMNAEDTSLVNLYESEEYLDYISLLRTWQQNGYLFDKTVNPGSDAYYLRSNHFFAAFVSAKPGYLVQEERYINQPLGFIPLADDYLTTDSANRLLWAIPEKSPNKIAAMQFLNLLYSDPTVINLWIYGLEGTHYVMKDAGKNIIGFPDGVDYTNSGYAPFMGFACGNQYLSYIWEGDSETIWKEMKNFNDLAERSPAFGFRFDSSPVIHQVNACTKILEHYEPGLMAGVYDLEEIIPEFQNALRKAGIETVIQEKQRQLDAWKKSVS